MLFKKLFAASAILCASAFIGLADPPSNTVNPRNAVLFNGWVISNAVPTVTNINTYTNVYLSTPYQHGASVTTILTATNQVVPPALNYTNYFDLGKVWNSNGVAVTNWTSDTPIVVIGAGEGVTSSAQARELFSTNFDGYELIRLTKISMNTTNNYWTTIILGQTP